MSVLSIVMVLSGYFPGISIVFWTIGLIIVGTGIVFLILGKKRRPFGDRRYRF